eukprot:GHVN01087022.1.p1 GENE.GHVN01087022.1~~GHVN01087022.1.p1  ORF type:complete len:260 (+),score=24.27 GHVN01087022.1:83-862(+)
MAERFLVPEFLVPDGVAPVPDKIRKKAELNQKLTEMKLAAARGLSQTRLENQRILKLKTYGYQKQYAQNEKDLVAAKRAARLNDGFFKEAEPQVLFVIRIKGINKLAPKPKKVLQLFRLRQLHNGVFVRVNKATMQMLKIIAPWVAFGNPSLASVRKLLYKRGYLRVGRMGARSRIRIQDTDCVQKHLGEHGIYGVEDMVHQIVTNGDKFKEVTNSLWTFKLSSPKEGFVAKRRGFHEPRGGDWGNRETYINDLIRRML